MFNDILRWWAQQMRSLLPSPPGSQQEQDALILRARGGAVFDLAVRRRGQRRPLGPVTLDAAGLATARSTLARLRNPGPAVLDLPDAVVLEQLADFPAAAEPELSSILPHEMDRLTPFSAADVFWGWRIAGRDAARGRITVALSLLPKPAAMAPLAVLAAAGIRAASLEAPTLDGHVRRIGVLPPGTRAPGRQRAVRSAAWVCAGLAVVALVLPVVQQETRLAEVDARIDALAPRIALVDALRRRLADQSGGAETFAAESARIGNALGVLASVTAALPEDTYLTEFSLRDHKISMTGRSADAVRLIGLLSAAPDLANPAFAAPVVRLIGDHGDQFTIRADLAP